MSTEPPRQPGPPEPPVSQEDVLGAVLADLGRRWGIVRRAAGRAMRQEGPATDAVRSARDHVAGMLDAVRGALPGGTPGRDEAPGSHERRD